MNIPNWKPLAIGVAGTLATIYFISRFLPGAAQRVGLQPRPWNSTQWRFYEPFGGRPLSDLWQANTAKTVSSDSSGGDLWANTYK